MEATLHQLKIHLNEGLGGLFVLPRAALNRLPAANPSALIALTPEHPDAGLNILRALRPEAGAQYLMDLFFLAAPPRFRKQLEAGLHLLLQAMESPAQPTTFLQRLRPLFGERKIESHRISLAAVHHLLTNPKSLATIGQSAVIVQQQKMRTPEMDGKQVWLTHEQLDAASKQFGTAGKQVEPVSNQTIWDQFLELLNHPYDDIAGELQRHKGLLLADADFGPNFMHQCIVVEEGLPAVALVRALLLAPMQIPIFGYQFLCDPHLNVWGTAPGELHARRSWGVPTEWSPKQKAA